MSIIVAPNELLAVQTAVPFQPVRLKLSNGSVYHIDSPTRMVVGTRVLYVGITAAPGDPISDRNVRIDPIHVVEIVPLATPPTVGGNGLAHA